MKKYYTFDNYEITNLNYITQKVNWLTPDFMGHREICEKIRFNENLNSAQERNYFSKLTCYTVNAKVIDEYLTLRRIHMSSTQYQLNRSKNLIHWEHENFLYQTWFDISKIKPGTDEEFFFLVRLLNLDRRNPLFSRNFKKIFVAMLRQRRLKKIFYLVLYKFVYFFFGGGFVLRRKLKRSN